MTISENHGKAFLCFGLGFVIFWLLKPKSDGSSYLGFAGGGPSVKRTPLTVPFISADDAKRNPMAEKAVLALKAYVLAYNAGESDKALADIVQQSKAKYQVAITKRADGKLTASDLAGNLILVNLD